HFGSAVNLAEERRLRADDLAGGLTLGGANLRRFLQRLAGDAALAAREIEDRHRVPECRVTRQRPAAPGLRVVRMRADTTTIRRVASGSAGADTSPPLKHRARGPRGVC